MWYPLLVIKSLHSVLTIKIDTIFCVACPGRWFHIWYVLTSSSFIMTKTVPMDNNWWVCMHFFVFWFRDMTMLIIGVGGGYLRPEEAALLRIPCIPSMSVWLLTGTHLISKYMCCQPGMNPSTTPLRPGIEARPWGEQTFILRLSYHD